MKPRVVIFHIGARTWLIELSVIDEKGLPVPNATVEFWLGEKLVGVFGLLIPELGQTEIFEAICKGMMEAQEAKHHALLWGNAAP